MIAAGPVPGRPAQEALRLFYSASAAGGTRMRTSLDGGKTWDAPTTVSEGSYGDVEIDGKGRVHLAVSMADNRGVAAWGPPPSSWAGLTGCG